MHYAKSESPIDTRIHRKLIRTNVLGLTKQLYIKLCKYISEKAIDSNNYYLDYFTKKKKKNFRNTLNKNIKFTLFSDG